MASEREGVGENGKPTAEAGGKCVDGRRDAPHNLRFQASRSGGGCARKHTRAQAQAARGGLRILVAQAAAAAEHGRRMSALQAFVPV